LIDLPHAINTYCFGDFERKPATIKGVQYCNTGIKLLLHT